MQIVAKSVHVIDYENDSFYTISPPAEFDNYVSELISHINDNTTIREFHTTSTRTEVIASVLDTLAHITDSESITTNTTIIAKRLLRKETETQQRIEHLDIRVQKGSLIQAMLWDEITGLYSYLLAKVEHGGFVDDTDFTFKSGFSKDKKTIWKTCVFCLADVEASSIPAKIYSNTAAKYWWSDFLELEPVTDDEHNTKTAFHAVEVTIGKMIRDTPFDHTVIRNAFVTYFKNRDHLDYDQMVHEVMDSFTPTDVSQEKLASLRDKLLELPDEKHFDRQFTPIASVIKAKIKKVYDVYQGIKLQITDAITDIEDVISAERDPNGTKYIKIKTTDDVTFKRFHKGGQ